MSEEETRLDLKGSSNERVVTGEMIKAWPGWKIPVAYECAEITKPLIQSFDVKQI